MKGVILAGGKGTRLLPLTKVTNKHLLPVYNKPMIYYPLNKLINAGIKEILIVSGPEYSGDFSILLKSGKEFNIDITYKVQDDSLGIAHALSLAENFAKGDNVAVILGDNIFEDNFGNEVKNFNNGAKVFLKEVPDPHRFGVAEVKDNKVLSIEEKPKQPKSSYAVTGFYIYDHNVFDIIKQLKPSNRGEYEITDVNNHYVNQGLMSYAIIKGYWSDAGTIESLHKASNLVKSSSQQ